MIDKNSLFDGVSIGKFFLCIKKKTQRDREMRLMYHFGDYGGKLGMLRTSGLAVTFWSTLHYLYRHED